MFQQILMTCFFLILASCLDFGSAKDLRSRVFESLIAEEDPIYRESPAQTFRQSWNNVQYPLPSDSDKKGLRKMIIKFEPKYMSIEKPKENATGKNSFSRREIFARMPKELKNLHFTVPGSERELGSRASKKLKLWLWNLSSCQVLPLWKDFGETIWPRYVNIGQCSVKKTCSYPKGMTCKPKYKRIHTLFWVCSRQIKIVKGTQCIWANYPTDVIEECKCSC